MVKQRRRQCVFRNLLSKCKVDSEGGKVGMILFGHLVATRGGGGVDWIQISKEFGFIQVFDPSFFMRERKSNWDFKSDQLIDCKFLVKVMQRRSQFFAMSQF